MSKKPVLLCIMDGFGWTPDQTFGNAVVAAKTPHLDEIFSKYPMTTIDASGMAVGLPDGQMGNSEVGHTNMGAGRIVYQQLTLITKSIRDGSMKENPVLVKNMKAAIDAGKAIHLMGLVGTGGVHSHADHWFGVLDMAKHMGATKVYLHCIMDGRDTDPHSGEGFLADLQAKLDELGIGQIATVTGRYYAMDRDKNWDREEKAYAAFVYGEGDHAASAKEAIETYRAESGVVDQDLPAFVIAEEGKPVGTIEDGDSVILFNFRGDRAQEISLAFDGDEHFDKFDRVRVPDVMYAGMLQYDADLNIPHNFLTYPPKIKYTLSEHLVKHGIRMYAISETQKYGHVTYFWNGNRSEKFDENLETYEEVKSDVVPFEQRPWMKSAEITDKLIEAIKSGQYDFLRTNYPNGDMVGHTGNYEATIIGVESVDLQMARVKEAVDAVNGIMIVTADHGNADEMYEKPKKEGAPIKAKTSHTLNKVPFIVYGADVTMKEGDFGLSNVAAVVTDLLDLPADEHWNESIINKK